METGDVRTPVPGYDAFRAQRYFPALDGVRALAVLLVFKVHVGYQPALASYLGGDGVTVFFVLSGLLITTLALREEQTRGRFSLRGFYVRRLFRIYPVYFAVLAFYCLTTYVVGLQPERRAAFTAQLPYYVLGLPEKGHFGQDGVAPPFAGAWSIGIEEKFYLVWPVLAFVLLVHLVRRPGTRTRARLGVCAVAALLAGLAPDVVPHGAYLEPYLFIVLGCAAALLLHEPRGFARLSVLGRGPVLLGLLLGFLSAQVLVGFELLSDRCAGLLSGPLAALALTGLLVRPEGPGRWLAARPLVFLGRISYAFYLLHNFPLNVVERTPLGRPGVLWWLGDVVVSLALAVLVSWVVHVVLEKPATRVGHRLAGQDKGFRGLAAAEPAPVRGASAGR